MAFKRKRTKELYLSNTSVENIFIHEYMVAAPQEHVKVYLLSLMYADLGERLENADIAKQLSMAEEDVLKAWTYWERLGAVVKKYPDSKDRLRYDIEFVRLKEQLYGNKNKRSKGPEGDEAHPLGDPALKALYRSVEQTVGRPLGSKDFTEIASWVADYKAAPEVIAYAYSYCVKNRKKDSPSYVGAVVKEWMEKELRDVSLIDDHLREVDQRRFQYKRILQSLGFTRNATEREQKLMDEWFDEMGFTIEKVLEACDKTSGISNPNINYVNKILRNWREGKDTAAANAGGAAKKPASAAAVQRYYELIRKQAESAANERKEKVYGQIPAIKEIDDALRTLGMEISRSMISTSADKKKRVERQKGQAGQLSARKERLLIENGFEADFMETKYRCAVCGDSGTRDTGERCSCFQEIQNEAGLWQKTKG